ncbi:MAG: UDP-glucose 4-epimerase GalE [bacterium]|nr:UDP-glucose 4-epimerase GalE [bacterium]
MKVLVTGGAGYIGSFTVKALKEAGYEPVIFDSLETGHAEAVEGTKIYQGNLQKDLDILDEAFKKERPEAVIHFAAYIEVGESVLNPQKYFANNVLGSMNLLKVMLENKVSKIVFSSTAAVYGEPIKIPVEEDDPKFPTNPYGESKLIVEKILTHYARAYKLSAVVLRYFNAAGAALDGNQGQDYPKPTHLITRACEAFLGKNNDFAIFGNDYATPDGTCIRDYVHVLDLASAHLAALKSFDDRSGFRAYNVGAGKGYSVLEVINCLKKVSGIDKQIPVAPRREGDPSKLTAGTDKIRKELGWEPKYSDLETIIKSSWLWHKNHPDGFIDQK